MGNLFKRDKNKPRHSVKNKREENEIQTTRNLNDNNQPTQTTRDSTNKRIFVRFRFQKKVLGNIIDAEDDFYLYQRETIEQAFNRYTTRHDINFYFKKKKIFFLISGNTHILLDNQIQIKDLSINSGDIIEVQSPEINLNFAREPLEPLNNSRKKIIITIIVIIIALVLILVGVLIYLFVFKKNKESLEEEQAQYQKEDLVVNINYTPDMIYRYKSNKQTKMKVEGENLKDEDSIPSIEQYIDFIFMIRNKESEIENNLIQKNWYSGYIGILDITINNGTNNMTILHDNNLNEYLKEKTINNLRNLNSDNNIPETDYLNENQNTSCFIKIDFYQNGKIKNIYLPNDFEVSNIIFIKEIIKLIIPKLSRNLYTKNINDKLEELKMNQTLNMRKKK